MIDHEAVVLTEGLNAPLPGELHRKLNNYATHSTARMLYATPKNAASFTERSNLVRQSVLQELIPQLRNATRGGAVSLQVRMQMAWAEAVDSERSAVPAEQLPNYELMYARLWEQAACSAAFGPELSAVPPSALPTHAPYVQDLDVLANAILDPDNRAPSHVRDRLVALLCEAVRGPRAVHIPDDPRYFAACQEHLRQKWIAALKQRSTLEQVRMLREYTSICANVASQLAKEPVTSIQEDAHARTDQIISQ